MDKMNIGILNIWACNILISFEKLNKLEALVIYVSFKYFQLVLRNFWTKLRDDFFIQIFALRKIENYGQTLSKLIL